MVDDAALEGDPGFGSEDAFLAEVGGFVVLKAALGCGVVDQLAEAPATLRELAARTGLPEPGLRMLLGMMEAARLVERSDGRAELPPPFAAVLRHRRRLLEAKISFLDRALRDVQERLPELLFDVPAFQARSETFSLFRYDRALDVTPEALSATREWVSYVTALSEAEAPILAGEMDLGDARRLLEIGGNTGVLAEALLAEQPQMTAVVLDLPAVCALGEERMRGRPTVERLGFLPGDARAVPWPAPVDAVLFKSVLHDWPEVEMRAMLRRAAAALRTGGQIIICERAAFEPGPLPLCLLANLVFAPFYRDDEIYLAALQELGLRIATRKTINLDLPFHFIAAVA